MAAVRVTVSGQTRSQLAGDGEHPRIAGAGGKQDELPDGDQAPVVIGSFVLDGADLNGKTEVLTLNPLLPRSALHRSQASLPHSQDLRAKLRNRSLEADRQPHQRDIRRAAEQEASRKAGHMVHEQHRHRLQGIVPLLLYCRESLANAGEDPGSVERAKTAEDLQHAESVRINA